MTTYVTIDWLLDYHRELMTLQGQQSGLLGDQGRAKLEAALARPQASAFGEDAFATIPEKAAAVLQGVAIAHAFTDGNKRAATAAMLAFLDLNAVPLDTDQDEVYDLVIAVTTGDLREVEDIAGRLCSLFPGLQ